MFKIDQIKNLPEKWIPLGPNIGHDLIAIYYDLKKHADFGTYAQDFCSKLEPQFRNKSIKRKKVFGSPKRDIIDKW